MNLIRPVNLPAVRDVEEQVNLTEPKDVEGPVVVREPVDFGNSTFALRLVDAKEPVDVSNAFNSTLQ